MHELTESFTEYCKSNEFDLSKRVAYNYRSLSACIIDCVYSLRAKYQTAIDVVDRYAEKYMGGNHENDGDTLSDFIERLETITPERFAENVFKNKQLSGGVLKSKVCLKLAKYLRAIGIETIEDFKHFPEQELLEVIIHAVKGMGDAGTNYLFMLAGDPDRCKPDVHIHNCIKDACGRDVSNEECQIIFSEAVAKLKVDYVQLTVRDLDSIIWHTYHERSVNRKK